MSSRQPIRMLAVFLVLTGIAGAGAHLDAAPAGQDPNGQQPPAPLFATDTVINVTIEAPFESMSDEEDGSSAFPARVTYVSDDRAPVAIAASARARGKSRLRDGICNFPGLMLSFADSALAGTLFAGQRELPVVTHCHTRRSDFEQYLLLEYLAYRTFAVLTDISLEVRLARIEYVDSEHARTVGTWYGFFLENWQALADRKGWKVLDVPMVPPDEYVTVQRNLVEVFEYLIGNTDWSIVAAEPDEETCCHNVVPIGEYPGPVFPVPYDFDQAGLVDPPYATPDPSIGIRNVRQRRYRGFCLPREQLDTTLTRFRDRAAEIYSEFRGTPGLRGSTRADALFYLDSFYQTISDPSRVTDQLVERCRSY